MDAIKEVESDDDHAESNIEGDGNDEIEPVDRCSCFSFLSKRKKSNQKVKGRSERPERHHYDQKIEADVKTDDIHQAKNERKNLQDNKKELFEKPSEVVNNEFGKDKAVESISNKKRKKRK